MDLAATIQKNLEEIRRDIRRICLSCGREPSDIKLIGVGKLQPVASLISAAHCGLLDFGENYVQELMQKQDAMKHDANDSLNHLKWHFIGRLQRRKVRQIVGRVDCIHSFDRIDLVEEVERWAATNQLVQDALIQVNTGDEVNKGGISPDDLSKLLIKCCHLSHIRIVGLMALPPYDTDLEKVRPHFKQLKQLRDAINEKAVYKEPLRELSMGMSQDYTVAIEEGATMIRIGTALFGERDGT